VTSSQSTLTLPVSVSTSCALEHSEPVQWESPSMIRASPTAATDAHNGGHSALMRTVSVFMQQLLEFALRVRRHELTLPDLC